MVSENPSNRCGVKVQRDAVNLWLRRRRPQRALLARMMQASAIVQVDSDELCWGVAVQTASTHVAVAIRATRSQSCSDFPPAVESETGLVQAPTKLYAHLGRVCECARVTQRS
jgi:hypothetical protein